MKEIGYGFKNSSHSYLVYSQLGNKKGIQGMGHYEEVELLFQGIYVILILFSINLESVDVILRTKWLCKLGVVKANWKMQSMKFWLGKETGINQRGCILNKFGDYYENSNLWVRNESEGFWVELD